MKNGKALKSGYILFRVDSVCRQREYFFTYDAARARRVELSDAKKSVNFCGLHITRGWESFYLSCNFEDSLFVDANFLLPKLREVNEKLDELLKIQEKSLLSVDAER